VGISSKKGRKTKALPDMPVVLGISGRATERYTRATLARL